MDLKILWTIAGSMGTVSDINMLKKAKPFKIEVVTADIVDKEAAGFILSGKKYILPKVRDTKYIDSILNICKNERITTVIPQYGDELIPMSESISRFESIGVKVLVTEDTEKLKIANDKVKLYDHFEHKDFIPKHFCVSTIDSLKEAVLKLGYPNVTVCVKPAQEEGSKGFYILTNKKINIFTDSNGGTTMNLENFINQLKNMDTIPKLLVLEYLPGKEYSVDCVCKNGETYICIPRQRIETSMGVATSTIIEKNETLIEYSKEIISCLNLSYNVNIQFRYSAQGKPMLIDLNPRVSGSLVANFGAGVNMLEASLRLAYQIPIENVNIKWGTKMLRYWSELFSKF